MPDNNEQMHLSVRELWPRFRGWFGALSLWVKIVIFLAVAAGIGLIFAQVAPNPPAVVDAELVLTPSTSTVRINSTLGVEVDILDPSRQDIYAAEVYVLYDARYLDISNITCVAGEDRCISLEGSLFSQVVTQEVITDNPYNIIHIVRGAPYPGARPGAGEESVRFVTLKFRTLQAGTTPVSFDLALSHVVMVATNGGTADILDRGKVHSGSYTIVDALTCTDPPPIGYGGYICSTGTGSSFVCSPGSSNVGACSGAAGSYTECPLTPANMSGFCRETASPAHGSNSACTYDDDPMTPDPCTQRNAAEACMSCDAGFTNTCFNATKLGYDIYCTQWQDDRCLYAECETGVAGTAPQVCLGSELPDADAASVCCDRPCSAIQAGQLYIINVVTTTIGSSSESITWNTYPVKSTASTCTTTVAGSSPTSTGNPDGHDITVTVPRPGTYSFTIKCSLTGFADAGYTGTFTILPSTAELLRIEDLAAGNVTCNSAVVTYGTTKEALGTIEYAVRPITTPATACVGLSYASMPQDTVATLAHRTIITSSTGLTANTEYCVRASAETQTTPRETSGYAYASFRTPECAAIAPDANVIMKVTRDRVCKNWLYCQSAVRLKNQQGKAEDMCFDLGVCDTLDPSGACANPVALEFATGRNNLTFDTPSQVHLIQDVSGYAKVGLRWSSTSSVDGLFPYVRMSEKGAIVKIPNGNFESGQRAPWRAAQSGTGIYNSLSADPANPSYVLKVVPGPSRWSGARVPIGAFSATAGADPMMLTFRAKTNMVKGYCVANATGLPLDPLVSCRVGAVGPGAGCVAGQTCTGKLVRAQLVLRSRHCSSSTTRECSETSLCPAGENCMPEEERFYDFVAPNGDKDITLNYGWATYQMRLGVKPEDGALPADVSGDAYVQLVQRDRGALSPDAFYIDDVSIQPVLETAAALSIPRSCRTYPKQDAPACDFLESASGKEYKGWKGYCVERQDPNPSRSLDPSNECLIWWPVDVILGTSDLFSSERLAGYTGRKPLYYCLESKGDWPYYDREVMSADFGQYGGSADNHTFTADLGGLHILKNEIVEVRVNDIEMDDDGSGTYECTMRNDSKDINPSLEGRKGTVILNSMNKDHWSDDFGSSKDCQNGITAAYNPFTYLRCEADDGDHSDDCDMISARLEFNAQDTLTSMKVYVKLPQSSGRVKFNSATITYRGERCNVIAQVVTPEGDSVPHASKITEGGWTRAGGNILEYPYKHDFEPYGGVVAPSGPGIDPGDPATWPGAAYVEAPLTQSFQQSSDQSYQYRAGSPYGVRLVGSCGNWVDAATGAALPAGTTLPSLYCQYNEDCRLSHWSGTCLGYVTPTGGRACITGNNDRLGQSCVDNTDCGYVGAGASPGICAGLDKPKTVADWPVFYGALQGGAATGATNASRLFARSYGVWAWAYNNASHKWEYMPCPNASVPYCVGNWDATSVATPQGQPEVTNIVLEGARLIDHAGGIALKFIESLDGDHKPLASFRVEWGDGSPVTEVTGLRMEPKASMEDPHVLTHTYQCGEGGKQMGPEGEYNLPTCSGSGVNCWDGTFCVFKPYVQVTDNWGLCNGSCTDAAGRTVACAGFMCSSPYRHDVFYPGTSTIYNVWQPYAGEVRVKP